jgi:hypothetical protein
MINKSLDRDIEREKAWLRFLIAESIARYLDVWK